jgi:hypothetical protein
VKALKKPSRAAWALNLAVLEGGDAIDALIAAIRQTLDVQAAGGDVRESIAGMRAAARDFANAAARAASRSGQQVDAGGLANALFAVLGKTESFDQLRRGLLTDVPEAGGLDLLTALPKLPDAGHRPLPSGAPKAKAPPPAAAQPSKRAANEVAARQAMDKAAEVLAAARVRSETARELLRSAEATVKAAEARLRESEELVRRSRGERDRAQKALEVATADVKRAESAAADAEKRWRGN